VAARTVAATIDVGTQPNGVAVDPAAGTVYVTNSTANTVSVIDAATSTVTATIDVPVGSIPDTVAVDPAAGTVYVVDVYANTVSVIDVATRAVTGNIAVGSEPEGVAVDPAAGTVYVTNSADNTVSVIDVATSTMIATIPIPAPLGYFPLGAFPFRVAVDPATHRAYVTNYEGGTVSVISAPRAAPVRSLASWRGRQPMDLAPSRDSRMMSAWPACCAVSAMMCRSTRRADHRSPGANQGAFGSGCAAFRSGSAVTSASVRRATSA